MEELIEGVNAKKCSKCKILKPLEAFSKCRKSKVGRKSRCKCCISEDRLLNTDKIAASRRKHYEENAEHLKAKGRLRYLENKKEIDAYNKLYYEKNKEVLIEYKKQHYLLNKDKYTALKQEYNKSNRPKLSAITAKYRAAKNSRTPGWLTEQDLSDMEDFYILAKALSEVTGEVYHVDHIIPLQGESVSGLHVPSNLQILTASENTSKRNKFTIE